MNPFNNEYLRLQKIGRGSFSNVYKARNSKNGELVALKEIFTTLNTDKHINILREVIILKNLKTNENIINYKHCFGNNYSFILVMEYTPWDLRDIMDDYNSLNQLSSGQKLFYDIVSGLHFMHNKNLIHCDLKPENVLVSDRLVAKIGDLGQTTFEGNCNNSSNVGTRWYKAIELLLGKKNYTKHVDLWSLGCMIFEWYRRFPIFNGLTDLQQISQIINLLGTPDPNDYTDWKTLPEVKKIFFPESSGENSLDLEFVNIPSNAMKIIKELLKLNPLKRATTAELLSMDYFSTDNIPQTKYNITRLSVQRRKDKRKKKEKWKKIILEHKINI
uniref:Cyclin-dependent kinase 7 (inferred by orthology to a human protein) n=1 Tax=Strongyloides venezuelensis TaxID=75913 RepID=A0A0K0FGC8_STRVS